MRQGVGLGLIARVSRRVNHRVHQPRVSIHADRCQHGKVPLITFFRLVHLGVARTALVLGRAGVGDARGINGGARFEQEAPGRKHGVDGGDDLRGQVIDVEQAGKSQDGALVGQPIHAGVELHKFPVELRVVQGLLHGRIRQGEPLLHEVHAKQRFHAKGQPASLACGCMRLNQPDQFGPRHDDVHLTGTLTLAHSLAGDFEPAGTKADLLRLHLTINQQAQWTYAEFP